MAEWDYAGLAGMDDFEELNQEPASFGSSYKEKEPSILETIKWLETSSQKKHLDLINEYKKILDIRSGCAHFKLSYENSIMEPRKDINITRFDYVMEPLIIKGLREMLKRAEKEYAAVNKKLEAVKQALT